MTKAITLRLRHNGEHTNLMLSAEIQKRINYLKATLPRAYFNFPEIVAKVTKDFIPVVGTRIASGVGAALIMQPVSISEAVNKNIAAEVNKALEKLRSELDAPGFAFSWVTAANYADSKVTVYVAQAAPQNLNEEEHHTYEISWWGK